MISPYFLLIPLVHPLLVFFSYCQINTFPPLPFLSTALSSLLGHPNLAITYLVEDMFTSMHFVLRRSFSNITLSFCLYTVSSQFFSVFAFLSVHAFISFLALAVLYVLALYL